ncbi:MAG: hypothetical protein LC796_08505 [Acidobacteria bacterium]|nr:hypothetical protein [Acidobacteriota bacterium]MCA1610440.1 hypothetical protein [Acidobacteriota bacterium]
MIPLTAWRLSLWSVVLLAGWSAVCLSQPDTRPGWTASTTSRVKPEMREEFEASLRQIAAAYRKAGVPWFLTVQDFAGDATEYTTSVPVMKFGDLDGPPIGLKMLGDREWGKLSRKMDRCYTAQTRKYAAPQHELEINKGDVPPGAYWLETTTLVAPGRMEDYLTWLKNDYRPALEKAGVAHFVVSRPIFGSEAGEVVSSRMLKNLAEIDGGPVLTKALGEAGAAAVNARSIALVRASTTRIVLVRTDLSYSAAGSPAD